MTEKAKTRTLTIKIHDVSLDKRWFGSRISFMEYGDKIGPAKKAVLILDDPSDVGYIRDKLDDLENYWKSRLGIKP